MRDWLITPQVPEQKTWWSWSEPLDLAAGWDTPHCTELLSSPVSAGRSWDICVVEVMGIVSQQRGEDRNRKYCKTEVSRGTHSPGDCKQWWSNLHCLHLQRRWLGSWGHSALQSLQHYVMLKHFKHVLVSQFSSWRQKFKVDKSNSVPAPRIVKGLLCFTSSYKQPYSNVTPDSIKMK